MPATPVMLMGLELKMACPRPMVAFGDVAGMESQASKGLKIAGVNLPSPGVTSPPGGSTPGASGSTLELMLMKNGWVVSGAGPPVAPLPSNRPARLSIGREGRDRRPSAAHHPAVFHQHQLQRGSAGPRCRAAGWAGNAG